MEAGSSVPCSQGTTIGPYQVVYNHTMCKWLVTHYLSVSLMKVKYYVLLFSLVLRVTAVKLFCNESGYFNVFILFVISFNFYFLHLRVCYIMSCTGVSRLLAIRQRVVSLLWFC